MKLYIVPGEPYGNFGDRAYYLLTETGEGLASHICSDASFARGDLEADPAYTYTIECPGRPHCNGWQECREPHQVDGRDADPDDAEEGDPQEGAEEWEFHGVLHTWSGWNGWTVPYVGCVVRDHPYTRDEASDLLHGKPTGRYLVRDNWDDDVVDLELVVDGDQS